MDTERQMVNDEQEFNLLLECDLTEQELYVISEQFLTLQTELRDLKQAFIAYYEEFHAAKKIIKKKLEPLEQRIWTRKETRMVTCFEEIDKEKGTATTIRDDTGAIGSVRMIKTTPGGDLASKSRAIFEKKVASKQAAKQLGLFAAEMDLVKDKGIIAYCVVDCPGHESQITFTLNDEFRTTDLSQITKLMSKIAGTENKLLQDVSQAQLHQLWEALDNIP